MFEDAAGRVFRAMIAGTILPAAILGEELKPMTLKIKDTHYCFVFALVIGSFAYYGAARVTAYYRVTDILTTAENILRGTL